jgi:hypothetical protein
MNPLKRHSPITMTEPTEILDELNRMRRRHQHDATRHLRDANRCASLHECLQEHYREQLAKRSKENKS